MNKIRQIFSYLQERKTYYDAQISLLQQKCPHEYVKTKRGSNTDNWDYKDTYWVDVKCNDCGKWQRFYSDTHPEEYRRYI